MTENQINIQFFIDKKRKERDQYLWLWNKIETLNNDIGLSDDTYKELQAKISSKIVSCGKSIQDHKKLL